MSAPRPKSLVRFIIEVIDEVTPGRGEEVYWRAFDRFEEYAHQQHLEATRKATATAAAP